MNCKIIQFSLVLLISLKMKAEPNCDSLEFQDPLLGPLVPCPWDKAKGMLCMKNITDVVVWPGENELNPMLDCGIVSEVHHRRSKRTNRRVCISRTECHL